MQNLTHIFVNYFLASVDFGWLRRPLKGICYMIGEGLAATNMLIFR